MNSRLFINQLLSAVLSAECRGLCLSFKVTLTMNALEKNSTGIHTRTHTHISVIYHRGVNHKINARSRQDIFYTVTIQRV